ncbi:MAG: helix-turn-helix domain-containing protein [Mucilaginibacter sp.]
MMVRYRTISEWFQAWQLPGPAHPLISVFQVDGTRKVSAGDEFSVFCDFYCVALKRVSGTEALHLKYGQQPYDFNEGVMSFVAPGQVTTLRVEKDAEVRQSGWYLVIHPDVLWNTPLAAGIKRYEFWDYAVHESLFLSEKEEAIITGILQNIQEEIHANLDRFSKQIIISQLESMLSYAERFYNRQFITREKVNHQVLDRLEKVLNERLSNDRLVLQGLPSVNDVASQLNVSPKYLSSLLKTLTGQHLQQHIHEKLIEKAKEKISTTELTVSEIAYELGFEHVQSFSRLFKAKTSFSPLEFRRSFSKS